MSTENIPYPNGSVVLYKKSGPSVLWNLNEMTDGQSLFYGRVVPDLKGITFDKLSNGNSMFYNSKPIKPIGLLLDENVTFDSLTSCAAMFRIPGIEIDLSHLTKCTFSNLTSCSDMFWSSGKVTLPPNTNFSSLTGANDMFSGNIYDEQMCLQVLRSLPSYDSGTHNIGRFGVNTFKNSDAIKEELGIQEIVAGNYSYRGWTVRFT